MKAPEPSPLLPPLALNGKAAYLLDWATLAPDAVVAAYTPIGNLGYRLDNLVVVDCDTAEGVAWWEHSGPPTPFQSIGRPERRSFWYRRPAGADWKTTTLNDALKVQARTGAGVQCAVPPSVHPDTGAPYAWAGPSVAPGTFMDIPVFPSEHLVARRPPATLALGRQKVEDWHGLTPDDTARLLEEHGWAGDGRGRWTRPGKLPGEGHGAELFADGYLRVYTDASVFPPNDNYSPFAVYAWLEHGGDYALARRAIDPPAAPTDLLVRLGFSSPRRNAVTGQLVIGDTPFTEGDRARLRIAARAAATRGSSRDAADAAEEALTAAAWGASFHPIHDYLNACVDAYRPGSDPIGQLASHLSGDPCVERWLRLWLSAAVRRAFTGVAAPMLVLSGPQGIGKSYLARYLGTPPALGTDYYVESGLDPDHSEFKRQVAEHWLWEVGELGATTTRRDIEALKHALTVERTTYRVPWVRNPDHNPALACFVGTVNPNGRGFLVDSTGNRRYLVLNVESIDWDYTGLDVDQIWGQAVKAYRDDPASANLTQDDRDEQARRSEEHRVIHPAEEWVATMLVPSDHPEDYLTSHEIQVRVKDDLGQAGLNSNLSIVWSAIHALGGRRDTPRINGRKVRVWTGVAWEPRTNLARPPLNPRI